MRAYLHNLAILLAVSGSFCAIAQEGPGGVRGDTENRFWFDAEEIGLNDNDAIQTWSNDGGNTNSAAQGTANRRPTFQSDAGSTINGFPVVRFDGSNDFLGIADNSDLNTGGFQTQRTFYVVIRTGADVTSRQVIYEEGGTIRGLNIYLFNGNLYYGAWNLNNDGPGCPWGFLSVNTPVATNTTYIVTMVKNGNTSGTGTITCYLNGTLVGTMIGVGPLYAHSANIGLGAKNQDTYFETGSSGGTGNYYGGDIAEFIHYNYASTLADRNLVHNYLSSKYNIAITLGDVYAMDTPANGDYDNDVAGIGQALDGTSNLDAQGPSIVRINSAAGMINGEYLLWGHDDGGFVETTTGTPASVLYRLTQVWRADEAGDVGNFNLTFDLTGVPVSGATAADFFLLVDGVDTDFSDATTTVASSYGSNIVTFNGVGLAANDHFTLGINPSVAGNTGPGGVRNTDSYRFWWRADDLETSFSDGDQVQTWTHTGGNSTNAVQNTLTRRPTFQSDDASSMNGHPVLSFDGNDDLFGVPDNTDINTGFSSSRTYHIVIRTGNNITTRQCIFEEGGGTRGFNIYLFNGNLYTGAWNLASDGSGSPWGFGSTNTAVATNTEYIITVVHAGNSSSTGTYEMYVNGTNTGTISNVGFLYPHGADIGIGAKNGTTVYETGTSGGTGNYYRGDVAEFIIYNYNLNNTERIVVENYLSAKYDIGLNAGDNYTQDNVANGDFDYDVAGIGRENSGDYHTDAKGPGIVRGYAASALNDGDYLLWGHNHDNTCVSSNVPVGVVSRFNRIWRVSETADVGTMRVSFDLTGMSYSSLNDVRLLIDTDGDLDFSNASSATPDNTSGNIVEFFGVDLDDADHFTLGTTGTLVELRDTTRWDGSSGTDWFTPANWSHGVPDSTMSIIVPGGLGNYPSISGGKAEVSNADIRSGATLEIQGTDTLDVHGNWNNQGTFTRNSSTVRFIGKCAMAVVDASGTQRFHNIVLYRNTGFQINSGNIELYGSLRLSDGNFDTGDSLIVKSIASGTGRILEITGGSITNEILQERYIDAGATHWRFFTSPVTSTDFEQFDDDFITSGITGTDFPLFDLTGPSATLWPSIYLYDEDLGTSFDDGFNVPATTSDVLAVGQGTWIWCGDTISGTQPFSVDIRGLPNTGDVDLPVSFNVASGSMDDDGWNMVGNPYPCPIDWDDAGWTKTNIENAIYVWNPDLQQYASYIDFVGVNGGSNEIASMQAFMVHADAASPVLTVRENCKVDSDPTFLAPIPALFRLRLDRGTLKYDETVVRFEWDGTNHFDRTKDALKPRATALYGAMELSTQINGERYSINTMHPDSIVSLDMNMIPDSAGTYTISVTDFAGVNGMGCVILEDLKTGIKTNLLTDTSYTFTSLITDADLRFRIHFSTQLEAEAIDISCNGETDGQVVLNGGIPGYNYVIHDLPFMTNGTLSQNTHSEPGLGAGTYTVQLSYPLGTCPPLDTTIVITEPVQLNVVATGSPVSCLGCCDGVVQLNISGGTPGYTVIFDGIAAGTMINGVCDGTHTYTITDANGCSQTGTIALDGVTGTLQQEQPQLNVYPNPGSEFIYFEFDKARMGTLELFDITGRKVQQLPLGQSQKIRVDLSPTPDGVYLYLIRFQDGQELMGEIVVSKR